MKLSIRSFLVAGGCLLMGTVAIAVQQDPAELGKKVAQQLRAGMEDPAAMAKWEETMKTGPAHDFLQAAFVGEWNLEAKMWMDPKADPMVSNGTASIEPMFGNRYIRERVKADMMGQPWEGEGTTGFDNNKKLFVSTWMDSMGTGIMMMKGSIGPDGKTMTFIGEMDEPMSGEMGKAIKIAITVDSKDKHRMEMYEILYGEPFKVMELTYTRKADNN